MVIPGFRFINDKEPSLMPSATEPTTTYDRYVVQGRTDHSALPTNIDTNISLSDYHLRWMRLEATDDTAAMINSTQEATTVVSTVGVIGGDALDTYSLDINGASVYSGVDGLGRAKRAESPAKQCLNNQ